MLINELKEIIAKVEQLKDEDQRAIAKLLEEELQWDKSVQSSQTQLSNLVSEALEEYRKGNTQAISKKKFVVMEQKEFDKLQLLAAQKTPPVKKLSLAAGKKLAYKLIDKWAKEK
jgi:hypothetical protein